MRVPARLKPSMRRVTGSHAKRYDASFRPIQSRPSIPTATAETGLSTFVAKRPTTRSRAVLTTLISPVVASTPYTYEPPATQYDTFAPWRSGPMSKRSPPRSATPRGAKMGPLAPILAPPPATPECHESQEPAVGKGGQGSGCASELQRVRRAGSGEDEGGVRSGRREHRDDVPAHR